MDAEGHNIRRGDGLQEGAVPGLVKDKADEAKKESGESAYNEETGEINWDCPVRLRPPAVLSTSRHPPPPSIT